MRTVSGDTPDVAAMRRNYDSASLAESGLAPDWTTQFGHWLVDAIESRVFREPNAMVLATVSAAGQPSARTVLLKGYDAAGLIFYTSYGSRKGRELTENPLVCCVFPWVELERQVVVRGRAERLPGAASEAYFATRPRGAQLGAWASPQSSVLGCREELVEAVARVKLRFPAGEPVPLPEHWGGVLVVPETVEFWQGRPDRLHDRLQYRRTPDGTWVVERLAP